MNHSEFAFLPMCRPSSGKPWFALSALRYSAKDSRNAFVTQCHGPAVPMDAWKALKIEGWRIVKVRVSTK